MGENALACNAGESVRIYLGNAGPALVSSFHVVGEIFDDVYGEGGTRVNQHNVQTTVVPVGGAAMVDFAVEVPGSYQFVDHSMFRAFNKGAMGAMEVEGAIRPALFSGRQAEGIFNPGTRLQRVAMESAPAAPTLPDAAISLARPRPRGRRARPGALHDRLRELPPARRTRHAGSIPAAGAVGLPHGRCR